MIYITCRQSETATSENGGTNSCTKTYNECQVMQGVLLPSTRNGPGGNIFHKEFITFPSDL